MNSKILVVEDEENLRLLYQMELEEEGYQVFSVASGQKALEELKNNKADLVVLDLPLRDGSGLDLMAQMLDADHDVKVVINTAYPYYTMDFQSWSAVALLVKSSDLTEFKNTIRNMVKSA